MLIKPSKAESLVDLQAEFNSLKIQSIDEEDEAEEVAIKVDLDWSLSKYYADWLFN